MEKEKICYILGRIEVAYWIYRLYSGKDSIGEILEGKNTIFGEIQQRFGKRNHVGL